MSTPPSSSPFAYTPFRIFLLGRVAGVLSRQIVSVSLGWYVYERTRSAWALAMLGLIQVVPVVALVLHAGALADRADRRRISAWSQLALLGCVVALAWTAHAAGPLLLLYALVFVMGCATAFNRPASSSLVPRLVPAPVLPTANAWSATSFELSAIAGPAAAGALLAWGGGATVAFSVSAVGFLLFAAALLALPAEVGRLPEAEHPAHENAELTAAQRADHMRAGVRFVFRSKLLLPAITLDLFAVLFGGATALLPIYARDVLHVGAAGLGWLRAAPSLGALVMALITTRMRPWQKPGRVLLAVVTGFGLATIVFGLSRSFALSLAALALLGAFDNVSVVIRQTLEQMVTPDRLRGRVSAVHYVFIGMSNELGEFESGAAAALMGPVAAVVFGGVMTIMVVAAVTWRWPALREVGPLAALRPEEDEREREK